MRGTTEPTTTTSLLRSIVVWVIFVLLMATAETDSTVKISGQRLTTSTESQLKRMVIARSSIDLYESTHRLLNAEKWEEMDCGKSEGGQNCDQGWVQSSTRIGRHGKYTSGCDKNCPCGKGNVVDIDNQKCAPCPIGHYCPESKTTKAIPCPAGKYGAQSKQIQCAGLCPAGKYGTHSGQSASTTCIPCPSGMYGTNAGRGYCSVCLPGKYMGQAKVVGQTSSKACTECSAGRAAGAKTYSKSGDVRFFMFEEPPTTAAEPIFPLAHASGATFQNFEGTLMERELTFDGMNDYIELSSRKTGDAMSIETYIRIPFDAKKDMGWRWPRIFYSSDKDGENLIKLEVNLQFNRFYAHWQSAERKECRAWTSKEFLYDEWIHIVAIFQPGKIDLYQNGDHIAKHHSCEGRPATIERWNNYIGRDLHKNWVGGYFKGSMRYIGFYDSALAHVPNSGVIFGIGLVGAVTSQQCQICTNGFMSEVGNQVGACLQPISPGFSSNADGIPRLCTKPEQVSESSSSSYLSFENSQHLPEGATLRHFDANVQSGWNQGGLAFDGLDDHVILQPWATASSFTIELFFKMSVKSSASRIIYMGPRAPIEVGAEADKRACFRADRTRLTLPSIFFPHVWVHIVLTVDSGSMKMKLYRNSKFILEKALGSNMPSIKREKHRIGVDDQDSMFFAGVVRYVGIYDYAMEYDSVRAGIGYAGSLHCPKISSCEDGWIWRKARGGDSMVGRCEPTQAGYYRSAQIGFGQEQPCSPGYYCPRGSKRPSVCDEGFYCPEASETAKGRGMCGEGYFCSPGNDRKRQPTGQCTYRTNNDRGPMNEQLRDAASDCGQLEIAQSELSATVMRPLSTALQTSLKNTGGLPMHWKLDPKVGLPPWMTLFRVDSSGTRFVVTVSSINEVAAGTTETLELECSSADAGNKERSNLTLIQTQVWKQHTSMRHQDINIMITLSVLEGKVLLLPPDNTYVVEINSALPSKALKIYNLNLKEFKWRLNIQGHENSKWLKVEPQNGTINEVQSGDATTVLELKMNALPNKVRPGTYSATVSVHEEGVENGPGPEAKVSLTVNPGLVDVPNCNLKLDGRMISERKKNATQFHLPKVNLSLIFNDAFGHPTPNGRGKLNAFQVKLVAMFGEKLRVSENVPLRIIGEELAFETVLAPRLKGKYELHVTHDNVHVHESPINVTFLQEHCNGGSETATPKTGLGCVCKINHERDDEGSCTPCEPGYHWISYSTGCVPCPEGTKETAGVCLQCDIGSVSDAGETDCKLCSAGRHVANNTCVMCGVGTYQDNEGEIICKRCLSLLKAPNADRTACTSCPSGALFQATISMEDCTPCPPATWRNDAEESCTACGPGKTSAIGSSDCAACDRGKLAINNTCIYCEPGFFQRNVSQACLPCPTGMIAPEIGSIICTPCDAGRVTVDNTCEACAAGKRESGSRLECIECAAGFVSGEGSVGCTKCSPGRIAVDNVCQRCSEGKYQKNSGGTWCEECESYLKTPDHERRTCVPCPAGSVVERNDPLWRCKPCAAATFAHSTNETCTPCALGRVSTLGSLKCEECGKDYFCTSGVEDSKRACPSDKTTGDVTDANEDSQCVCQKNLHLNKEACDACPRGVNCSTSGATLQTLAILPGFWRASSLTATVYPCRVQGFCTQSNNSECREAHTGVQCEACIEGYVRTKHGCKFCTVTQQTNDEMYLAIELASMCLVLVAGLFFVVRYDRIRRTKAIEKRAVSMRKATLFMRQEQQHRESQMKRGVATFARTTVLVKYVNELETNVANSSESDSGERLSAVLVVYRLYKTSLKVKIKIILGLVQVASATLKTFEVDYPQLVEDTSSGIEIFNFNVASVLSFECAINYDFYTQMATMTLVPIFVVIVILVAGVIQLAVLRARSRRLKSSISPENNASSRERALKFKANALAKDQVLHDCMGVAMLLMFIVYPSQ